MLTPAQQDALGSLAWGTYHFGSLLTGRQTPRRVVMALCRKGLAQSVGLVEPCDDDGFRIEGRLEREGFSLTPQGIGVAVASGCYYAEKLRGQQEAPGHGGGESS